MPGLSQGRSVVVIGCDDAEGPSFFRLRIDAPLKRALHQLAGSTLIHFSVDEVMTVLVVPATIALVVDLSQTPSRLISFGEGDDIPSCSRKTSQGFFHLVCGRKAGKNESGR